jgi:hypothetical protein
VAKETRKPPEKKAEEDAKGQFAKEQHGAKSDGVSSADPKNLSKKKSGDATFSKDPKHYSTPHE